LNHPPFYSLNLGRPPDFSSSRPRFHIFRQKRLRCAPPPPVATLFRGLAHPHLWPQDASAKWLPLKNAACYFPKEFSQQRGRHPPPLFTSFSSRISQPPIPHPLFPRAVAMCFLPEDNPDRRKTLGVFPIIIQSFLRKLSPPMSPAWPPISLSSRSLILSFCCVKPLLFHALGFSSSVHCRRAKQVIGSFRYHFLGA